MKYGRVSRVVGRTASVAAEDPGSSDVVGTFRLPDTRPQRTRGRYRWEGKGQIHLGSIWDDESYGYIGGVNTLGNTLILLVQD